MILVGNVFYGKQVIHLTKLKKTINQAKIDQTENFIVIVSIIHQILKANLND